LVGRGGEGSGLGSAHAAMGNGHAEEDGVRFLLWRWVPGELARLGVGTWKRERRLRFYSDAGLGFQRVAPGQGKWLQFSAS
jgi:hypothetical protein